MQKRLAWALFVLLLLTLELPANRVDFGLFFHNYSNFTPLPQEPQHMTLEMDFTMPAMAPGGPGGEHSRPESLATVNDAFVTAVATPVGGASRTTIIRLLFLIKCINFSDPKIRLRIWSGPRG